MYLSTNIKCKHKMCLYLNCLHFTNIHNTLCYHPQHSTAKHNRLCMYELIPGIHLVEIK